MQMHSNKPACGGRKAGGDPEMPSGALPPSKWHKAEAQSLVVLYRAEADFKCWIHNADVNRRKQVSLTVIDCKHFESLSIRSNKRESVCAYMLTSYLYDRSQSEARMPTRAHKGDLASPMCLLDAIEKSPTIRAHVSLPESPVCFFVLRFVTRIGTRHLPAVGQSQQTAIKAAQGKRMGIKQQKKSPYKQRKWITTLKRANRKAQQENTKQKMLKSSDIACVSSLMLVGKLPRRNPPPTLFQRRVLKPRYRSTAVPRAAPVGACPSGPCGRVGKGGAVLPAPVGTAAPGQKTQPEVPATSSISATGADTLETTRGEQESCQVQGVIPDTKMPCYGSEARSNVDTRG
ncbi:hypothetical protein Anapl_06240 [Anas platyrhynchos]|uniref:Uncharacterized protein n=1 Tax=Anas platyrhynchos TaxID=8839 RepID=R0JYP6_ANAPL|nr:hypothetical protein Anapl_06240 [Anas platyrhynchos]